MIRKQSDKTYCLLIIVFFYILEVSVLYFSKISIKYYQRTFFTFSIIIVFITIFFCKNRLLLIRFESYFFILSSLLVTIYILSQPIYTFGGDSTKHLNRVISFSKYRNVKYNTYVQLRNKSEKAYIISLKEMLDSKNTANDSSVDIDNPIPLNTFKYKYIAYVPYIIGFLICGFLRFSPHTTFLLSLHLNAIFIIMIYYYSIKKLKYGKNLLCIFALFPIFLRLMCVYSYTPWVIAWLTFFSCYIFEILQNKRKIENSDIVKLLFFIIIGLGPKPVYFFIILLVFLIPNNQYISKKQFFLFRIFSIITILGIIFYLLLPLITFGDFSSSYSDLRGGSGVNAGDQLKFILFHPFQYAKILFVSFFDIMRPSSSIFGPNGLFNFKYGISFNSFLLYGYLFLFVFVFFTDNDDINNMKTMMNRIFVILVCFIQALFICTVLYMNFTEVQNSKINGCNPIYLETCFFPLLLFLQSKVKIISIKNQFIYSILVLFLQSFFLMAGILDKILLAYIP